MIIGLFLIIVGFFWILSSAGLISARVAEFFWPAILIAVGIQLIFGKYIKDCCQSEKDSKKPKD